MKYPLVIALIAAGLVGCNKKTTPVAANAASVSKSTPTCIQQKIQGILAEPVQNLPTRVVRVTYNSATAYYLTAPCCDQFSELYDKSCNLICHPDGGITGRGDGKCSNLWSTVTDSVEIWRDTR